MSSPSIEVKRDHSHTRSAREGNARITVGGVRITDRTWGDATVRLPDEYVSDRSASLDRVRDGQVFQIEIRDEKKTYAYKLKKIKRDDHMEYDFRSCYGDFSSSRDIQIFEPDEWGSTDYYYGMQDKIKSDQFEMYWVDDNYLLSQLGREELAVSATI